MNRSTDLRRRSARYIAGGTFLAVFACAKDDMPGADVDAGLTSASNAVVDSTPVSPMTVDSQAQPITRDAVGLPAAGLDRSSVVFHIGEEDGDSTQTLGSVRDVAVDDAGNVFVLDEQELNVRWFDSSGVFRGTAGRAGRGPGEFRAPMTISSHASGTVQVVDMAQRSIASFGIRESEMHHLGSIPLPVTPLGFCSLSGAYYILSKPVNGSIVTAVDATGRVLRSFGRPVGGISKELKGYESIIRESQTRGRILCVRSPATIVVFPEQIGTIRAFSPSGDVLWTTELKNYHASRWVSTSSGGRSGLMMAPDPVTGTAHSGGFLMQLNDSLIGLQLSESSMNNPEGRLEVRVLSIRDGKELGSFPQSFALVGRHGNMLYAVQQQPYPRVLAIRARPQ